METIKLILKGFVVGIANIIPGVSGGTLALTLGIYEKLIGCISHILSNLKENLKFLIPIGIGMGLSILTMSHLVTWSFENIEFPTSLLFMGLVIGGIPLLFKKVKNEKIKISNIVIFIISFSLVIVLAFSKQIFGSGLSDVTLTLSASSLVKMILIGIIAAATMIIPGVSGSLVLMLLGYYKPVLEAIKAIGDITNLINLCFFGIGVLVGIIGVSKLLEMLFKKHEVKTYYGVLGFISSSIIAIPVSVINEYGMFTFSPLFIILGIILFVAGMFIGNKLGEL